MPAFIFIIIIVVGLIGLTIFMTKKRIQRTIKTKQMHQLKGALISKEIQSQIIINSISDGILVTDTQNQIILFNSAAAEMTEWPIDEALNLDACTILKLITDAKTNDVMPNETHPLTNAQHSQQEYKNTVELISRTNKRRFISLAISPVIEPNRKEFMGLVAVFRDVSKEKTEEQQRADFVSTASHEMRTPVAAIEGYLALAMNPNVSKVDEKAREYLEKAHANTKHLGQLFQDLLTSAKAEDGRLTSNPTAVEVSGLVEDLVQDLKFSADKKGLSTDFVTSSISPSSEGIFDARGKTLHPLYFVYADPERLREVITNIFDNAVKYTDEGKITLSVTGNEQLVQISVQDTGHGIPSDDIPHLFQKFYRVDSSNTRTVGGTGLGLFICRKIVELYGGTIWAESEVEKGSTFYINMPRINSQKAQQIQEAESIRKTQAP